VAFSIGFGFGNSASADPTPPSPSGTSIPVKKGGTGSTTEQGALQNLLPDFDSNTGKVLGSTGTEIGWVEQAKSSDDIGKVKIDSTDKTMTTNGEIGVNGASQVSINRPDLWTAGVEYDFGNGLYGYRKQGTITSVAGEGELTSIISNAGATKLISSGGSIDRGDAISIAVNGTLFTFVSSVYYQTGNINMYSVDAEARADAPYDIWVIYKK
jgi:hypothetical protein